MKTREQDSHAKTRHFRAGFHVNHGLQPSEGACLFGCELHARRRIKHAAIDMAFELGEIRNEHINELAACAS